jgi:predicted ATPase
LAGVEALQRKVQGATRERMLREMSEGIEVLTEQRPFILLLEDLHWSDVSTLELIAALTRRQERARLLVIGTYRPVEMLSKEHPLNEVMQELHAHHLCAELALGLLSEADVAEYLRARFPVNALPASFAQALHQRTEGNPLFLVNVVDDLVAQEVIAQGEEGWTLQGGVAAIEGQVPESIRHLIAKQSKRLLPAEQRILQAASVAGMEFSTAAVAAALEADEAEVEEWCIGLAARQHFLRRMGISQWPDGTVAERYGFLHALYQHLWHEQVGIGRRRRLHMRIGERQEAAYGDRTGEIAAELAVHFEQGRDYERAVRYLQQAAGNALQRSAYQEATNQLTKGLELLKVLPDASGRNQHELALQTVLGPVLIATKGWSAQDTGHAYTRARELCQQLGDTPQLFSVLFGQWAFHLVRGEHQTACDLSTQLLRLAQKLQDSALLLEAHWTSGCSAFFLGEFLTARAHFEQGLSLYDPQQHSTLAFLYGQDPAMSCLCYLTLTLWHLGYPDQALRHRQETLILARSLNHPFSLAWALGIVPVLPFLRHEEDLRLELINEGIALSTEHGFAHPLRTLSLMRHCGLIAPKDGKEGIARLREQLATYRAPGVDLYVSMLLGCIAEACSTVGYPEEGLETVREALALLQKTGERQTESELHRLKGELMLQAHLSPRRNKSQVTTRLEMEAEGCFLQAIDVAQRQGAKMCELRAAMSLGRLWQRQGKCTIARQQLAETYDWFTEGFETDELKQAKALLEELA